MNVLLHICCAPCSIMCIQTLRGEGIEPVGFWDNPNIHPFTEFRMRRNTLVEYARSIGLELVVYGGYGLRPFLGEVGGDFAGRCRVCYRLRMRSAARRMRRSSSASSLHAMTSKCARIEVSPNECASFKYRSIHSLLIWFERE